MALIYSLDWEFVNAPERHCSCGQPLAFIFGAQVQRKPVPMKEGYTSGGCHDHLSRVYEQLMYDERVC